MTLGKIIKLTSPEAEIMMTPEEEIKLKDGRVLTTGRGYRFKPVAEIRLDQYLLVKDLQVTGLFPADGRIVVRVKEGKKK